MHCTLATTCLLATSLLAFGCGETTLTEAALHEASAVQPGACYSSEHCGPGTVCARFDDDSTAGRCYRACVVDDTAATCPGGSVCSPVRDGVSTSAVGEPNPDGACLARTEAASSAWAACSSSTDCADTMTCAQLPDTLGSRCVQLCDLDSDCAAGACALELGVGGGETLNACATICTERSSCALGEVCAELGSGGLCVR